MPDAGETPAGPAWLEFGRAILTGATDPEAALDTARRTVGDALVSDAPFAALVTNLRLNRDETEALALLAAAEASWPLQRTVGELHGDLVRNRLSLGLLSVLFGPTHAGPLAVTPGSRLQHAAMVTVDTAGPWSDHLVMLHPSVVWALIGDVSIDPDLPVDATWVDDGSDDDALSGDVAEHGGADLVVVSGVDRMRRRIGRDRGRARRPLRLRQRAVDHRGVERRGPRGDDHRPRSADRGGRQAVARRASRHPTRRRTSSWVVSSRRAPSISDLPERPWVEIEAPGGDATLEEWAAILGDVEPDHRLTLDQLHQVAGHVMRSAATSTPRCVAWRPARSSR